MKNQTLIGFFLCLVVFYVEAKSRNLFGDIPPGAIAECEKETTAKLANIISGILLKKKLNQNQKCLQACLAKKLHVFDNDEWNKEEALKYSETFFTFLGSPDIEKPKEKLGQALDVCVAKNIKKDTDCETVYAQSRCIVREFVKEKWVPDVVF